MRYIHIAQYLQEQLKKMQSEGKKKKTPSMREQSHQSTSFAPKPKNKKRQENSIQRDCANLIETCPSLAGWMEHVIIVLYISAHREETWRLLLQR
jgi:hypothetical protein